MIRYKYPFRWSSQLLDNVRQWAFIPTGVWSCLVGTGDMWLGPGFYHKHICHGHHVPGITHTPCQSLICQGSPNWVGGQESFTLRSIWRETVFRWQVREGILGGYNFNLNIKRCLSIWSVKNSRYHNVECFQFSNKLYIFVIFDEVTNVKIKPVSSSCLHLCHQFSIKIRAGLDLVQVLAQFMIIKRWPGLFVRTFHIKYFDNTNQVSGKWLGMASLCK